MLSVSSGRSCRPLPLPASFLRYAVGVCLGPFVPDRPVGLVHAALAAEDEEAVESPGEPPVVGDGQDRPLEALKALLVHEHGIAPGDLQAVHTNIAIHSAGGSRKIESAVAVFDTIPGGLRLSAPLFSEFADMLDRLARGIAMAGTEALVSSKELDRLRAWHGQLRASAPQGSPAQLSEGQLLIYAPGSRVQVTVRGQSLERHIGEPQLVAIGEEERLMYRYEIGDGAHGWVADDQISPSGNDWTRARWNPLTNVIEPLEAGR